MRVRPLKTPFRAPQANTFCERVVGTIRRECLDHVIVFGEEHAREILGEYVAYYDEERTHQALGPESPVPRDRGPVTGSKVISISRLGGLHHSYRRAA